MAEGTDSMDLGDFEMKVDQMAAMLNQLQETGRQNEAVSKLKQLMSTLVKVCPESIPSPLPVNETGDHYEEVSLLEDEATDSPEAVVSSILSDLVSKAVSKRGPKLKRLAKTRACKPPSSLAAVPPLPGGIVKRKRGRPPKHLQAVIRAEKVAKRKEMMLRRQALGLGLRGRRKNPNPQKLPMDDSDEDPEEAGSEQPDVTYVCDKCKDFSTKGVSKFIRHMRLHGQAMISCFKCRKELFSFEEFQRHQCGTAPPSPKKMQIKCDICEASFIRKKMYKVHMRTEHNVSVRNTEAEAKSQFKCAYCDEVFSRKLSMFAHYKDHAGDQWVCQTCGDFSPDFDAYTQHMAQHTKDSQFSCDKCSLAFTRKQQYEQHMQAHQKYDCAKCSRAFSTKKDLQRHERRDHGVKVPWEHKYHQCPVCFKSYPRPGMVEIHMRIHTGEKPLECTTCKLFFRTPKALSKHKQTFSHMQRCGSAGKERRYLCSLCGKSYFRRQALLRHQKYHSGEKPFQCPHCEYRCPEANNLKRHMLLHFSSQRSFMCEICGSSFHAKKTLEMHHIYKHSEDRQYPCTQCNMSFKAANALRRHLKSHSTDKPFRCWCGASFNRQYNLRRHMKSVHGTDEALPPVRKVTVLDVPPEELAARAEAEKATTKAKGKRGRKSKHILAAAAAASGAIGQVTAGPVGQVNVGPVGQVNVGPVGQVSVGSVGQVSVGSVGQVSVGQVGQVANIQAVNMDSHPQHIVITTPQTQHHQITDMTEQEIHQHVMASLPRVIEDHPSLMNSHLQHQEVQIHHVQLTEVHVQQPLQPDIEAPQGTVPTHVIVSAQDSHSMTNSPVSRPMSVPHPSYGIPSSQQQWHLPVAMPTQVITSQHLPVEHEQQQQQQTLQSQQHVSRSETPTSQDALSTSMSLPGTRHLRQALAAGTSLLHDRPMSHPSVQSMGSHQLQIQAPSGHIQHPHHPTPQHPVQQVSQHLPPGHHISYPDVTYATADQSAKHMVIIPSIAPGTEVSPQEEQFLAKAEQAVMENLPQYQPGSTGYTGLPILLHQINTTN